MCFCDLGLKGFVYVVGIRDNCYCCLWWFLYGVLGNMVDCCLVCGLVFVCLGNGCVNVVVC